MSSSEGNHGASTFLMVPIVIFFGLLMFTVIRAPALISPAGIGSAVIVVAPLILATYALTIIVMAGRAGVDLSIGPLIGFLNVGMVQLHGIGFMDSPIAFFLYAMGVGIAYQVLIGLVIVFVRVQPIIVSLSGYLTLVGLNLIVMPRPGGLAPEWMLSWGAGTTLFSPVLVILVLATIGWYLLARTAFFTNLKMMGSDERAAYTSGVPINLVRLGAHAIGGLYAGLAALTFTSLISSGDPTQGTTYTLMAVTALVLGGANLAGGRGSAFGSMLGALNIYLITYALSTFNFGKVQSFVTDLSYGAMLVMSLLIGVAVPQLQKYLKHVSPLSVFMLLAVVAAGVVMHTTLDQVGSGSDSGGIQSAMSSFSSSTIGGSLGGAAAAVEEGYSAGTIILWIVLGIAGIAYLFSLLFKYANASMVALTIVIVVTAFGLAFNSDPVEVEDNVTSVVSAADSYQPLMMSMEPRRAEIVDAAQANSMVSQGGELLIISIGVVLLSTTIILLALPQVDPRVKRRSLSLLAVVVGILAIGSLFYDGKDASYLQSNFSGEIYAILLVGALLFTLTAPLVHTRFTDISRVFIGSMGVFALVCVYFFTAPASTELLATSADNTKIEYTQPVLSYIENASAETPDPIAYSAPARVQEDESGSVVNQLSFGAIAIVLLHVFVRLAMGETSFRSFWRYWHIVAFSVLGWCTLLYASGFAFWKLLLVVVIAVLSAPNVMHVISTYVVKQRRDNAISQWEG